MKILELYLDGFGHFHQRKIGPLTDPVTIIRGPNEAGKSTLLAFIRTMLFGFPQRYNGFYQPRSGGMHGGWMTLVDDDGSEYIVERFAGGKGGKLSVTSTKGMGLDGDHVLRRLTGEASSDIFRTVFAFSLDELQSGQLLEEEVVKGSIYGATLGVPRLAGFTKEVETQKNNIFRPQAKKQRMAQALDELQALDNQLKELAGNAARYGDRIARRAEIQRELENADAELAQNEAKRREVENLLKGWEDWVALVDCESKLEDIPQFEHFPDDPIVRLENYEDRLRQARDNSKETADRLRQAQEATGIGIADEVMLEDWDTIELIRRGRSRFDESVGDLPERKADLRALEEDGVKALRDLAYDWDEARLTTFNTSIAVRNEVDQWKQQLEEQSGHTRQSRTRLEQEQRTLLDCETEEKEAREKLPNDPPSINAVELEQRRADLRIARRRLNEYERSRQNHDNLRSQLDAVAVDRGAEEKPGNVANLTLPLFLGLVGVILAVTGILMGEEALLLGMVGGLSLIGIAVYLFTRSRLSVSSPLASDLRRRVGEAREAQETERKLLVEAGAALELREVPHATDLDAEEAWIGTIERESTVWKEIAGRVDEAARRLALQRERATLAAQEHHEAAEAADATMRKWQEWLGQRGLAETLTPDTMVEFLARVDVARTKYEQVRQMRNRVSAIEKDITEYVGLLQPLVDKYGSPFDPDDPRQISSLADSFIETLDNVRNLVRQRDDTRKQAEEYQRDLEQRKQHVQEAEQVLQNHLSAGGTDDPEEFRRRARRLGERRDLEREHDECLNRIRILSGPGDELDAFRKAFEQANLNQLNEDADRLSQRTKEIGAMRNALLEERGGIENELNQLTSEEGSSVLRARRNTMLERLRDHAREWSELKVAELLLEKTRQKFERERQPNVIQHAQGLFSTITGERYQSLYAPLGEQTVTVMDQTGYRKEPSHLSRGTREQLYLALRFGLIREFGEHAERLPVVVDEVLVNFDPERALRAAIAFVEISKTNQVLVFTCHPEVVQAFQKGSAESGCPPPQLINIE